MLLSGIAAADESTINIRKDTAMDKDKGTTAQTVPTLKNPDLQTLIKMTVERVASQIQNPLYGDPVNIETNLLILKSELIAKINRAIIESNMDGNHAKWPTITDFSKWGTFIIKEVIFTYYEVYSFIAYKGDSNGIGLVFSRTSDDPYEVLHPLVDVLRTFAGAWLIPGTYKKVEELAQIYLYDKRVRDYINDGKHDPEDKAMSIPAANGVVIRNEDGSVRELISYREAKERGLLYNIILPWNYLGKNNPVPEIPDDLAPNGIWRPNEWVNETHAGEKESIDSFYNMLLGVVSLYDTKHWKGMFILRDQQDGNTGKSTEINLCRNMTGDEHVANLPMAAFSKSSDFALEPLADNDKCLVAYDENEPNKYLEKVEALKCACTTDPFIINRKGKPVVSYVHRGRIIQGYNGILRTSDNTDSFYRRFMVIEYSVKFGKDKPENKNIKSDYIKRQEVLDYFGTEAINRNVLNFPNTERQKEIINEMKTQNDTVRSFFEECVADMMQNHFTLAQLYPVYTKYCAEKEGECVGEPKFKNRAQLYLASNESDWTYTPRKGYPNTVGNARVSSHHVPFNKLVSFKGPGIVNKGYADAIAYTECLRDDPVFDMLFDMLKNKPHDNKYRLILKAFDNLYSGDGNKSDKIYYRKTHAEINNLLRMFTYYYDYDPEESPYEEMVTAIHDHKNDNWFIGYIAGRLEELGA